LSRHCVPFSFLLALLLIPEARAEVIDRIAVSVGNQVITTSDIDTALRVTALFNGAPLDFSPANKRATADRLVEQRLIQKELEDSKYPVPDAAAAAPQWEDFHKTHTEQQIAAYGLTDQEIKDALLWQLTLLRFIEVRFRPGVQVSNADIQDYFEKVVKPAAEASGDPASLDDYRARIETTLTGERTDQEADNWLKEARKRTHIVYHEEVFQ
jgi:hypothetical protein